MKQYTRAPLFCPCHRINLVTGTLVKFEALCTSLPAVHQGRVFIQHLCKTLTLGTKFDQSKQQWLEMNENLPADFLWHPSQISKDNATILCLISITTEKKSNVMNLCSLSLVGFLMLVYDLTEPIRICINLLKASYSEVLKKYS